MMQKLIETTYYMTTDSRKNKSTKKYILNIGGSRENINNNKEIKNKNVLEIDIGVEVKVNILKKVNSYIKTH